MTSNINSNNSNNSINNSIYNDTSSVLYNYAIARTLFDGKKTKAYKETKKDEFLKGVCLIDDD